MTGARTRPQPARADQDETQAETAPGGAVSRLVLWAGVTAGTALVVLAEWRGAHPRIGGMPTWLGYTAGFAAAWLAVTGLSVWAAALLRRYRRAIAAGTIACGRRGAAAVGRGAAAAGRGTRRHGGRLAGRIHAQMAARWRDRGESWRDPLFVTRRPAPAGGDQQDQDARDQAGDHDNGQPSRAFPDCAGCPHPYHWPTWCPEPGCWCGQAAAPPRDDRPAPADQAGAPAPARRTGGTTMTTTTRAVPAHWRAVAAATADFEPGSDAELLEWMSAEVAGMLGYGEAVTALHEHCVTAVRADPAAMAALHDVADAAADCAEAMARAMARFKEIYEAPREFVNEGGVLPKDGDWLQGDDE